MNSAIDMVQTGGAAPPPGILVDNQILRAMDLGLLKIDPFDASALEPATYDLRLGSLAAVSTAGKPINLRETPLLTLEPYASAMVQSEEILSLSGRIVGRLGPRSNVLRHGIFVSAGPQIDPGFRGRIFVNLLNVTDHPYLIRYQTRFLSVEFHLLAQEPSKIYAGPNQDKTELSAEDINRIIGRGEPSLKDIHHTLLELKDYLKDAAVLGRDVPRLVELQEEAERKLATVSECLRGLVATRIGPVPITVLEPGRYELRRDIPAALQPVDDGFTATFFDANISASGDTEEEAISNLRSLIVDIFKDLESEAPERLGPEPKRQLEVLRAFIRRV